jgi:hypothetical protein
MKQLRLETIFQRKMMKYTKLEYKTKSWQVSLKMCCNEYIPIDIYENNEKRL